MYPQIFNYKTVRQVQCRGSTFSQFRLSLIILNKLQSVINIMGKSAIWTVLCFYPFPPLNNIEKQWAKVASSYIMGSRYRRGGEGGFLTHLNILSLTSEIYKKKKKWGAHCHEQSDSKSCQNDAQNAAIMFLSYCYLALVGKGLLQAHNGKSCGLVKLLCIYFCYFILLNHG